MIQIVSRLFTLLILVCVLSCSDRTKKTDSNFIDISNPNLEKVIREFQDDYLFHGKIVDGVAGVRINNFCDNAVVEIWKINHMLIFFKNKPWKYTYVNDLPVFVFSDYPKLFGEESMQIKQIEDVIKYHGVVDMSKPPRTEYTSKVLYRYGDPSENKFNVVDTLLKYKNPDLVDQKINYYIGNSKCY